MRKSFFTAFLFFLFALAADEEIGLIPSNPDQIASLNYDSGFLIGGCVNPASGQLCLSSVDLVAKGAQELSLFRVYIPPVIALPPRVNSEMQEYYNERSFLMALQKSHRGWVFLPHLKLERKGREIKVPDSNGAIYSFSKGKLIHTSGMSNISGDIPLGKFDPRNIRIGEDALSITVLLPNGTKRLYNHHEKIFYNLVKEVLPNGKVIKYTYLDNQILIQSLDPLEKHVYASLTIDTSSYKNSFHLFDETKKGSCGEYRNNEGELNWSSTGVPYLAVLAAKTNTGLTAASTYHPRGFSNESENFSKRLKTKREYNAAGQLKKVTETGDGIAHTTLYDYNRMGRLEKETDPFENVIQYKEYDSVVNQPILTEFPPIDSIDGELAVVRKKSYDGLGRIIIETDANKQVMKYKYNAYGSPIEITYPNGSKETFLNYKNGELRSHTNRENLVTEFSYDVLKRVIEKRYLFEEKLLANETFVYNSFHLKSHTDKEGYVTTYEYDCAGRKIEENREGRVVVFGYDVLGRVSSQTHMNGVQIFSEYDKAGNLKEKQRRNASGTILHRVSYTYNPDGDRETITYYPNNRPAQTTFSYDPLRRLTGVTDPLGFTTSTTYDESKTNSLSQRVLTKTITDPNNISTVITHDPYDREAIRKISNLRTEERWYDPAGNLLQVKDGSRITRYTYNSLNLTETLIRAFGTSESRVTTYGYTLSGLLKTKVQPNGIALNYTYDPNNLPNTLNSSDGPLSHFFTYNSNGDLLHASDNTHTVDRTLDPFGNTLTETVDGKWTLAKTYDCLDRPLTLTLPDQSSLRYTYDSVYLKTVERLSSSEEVLYTHTYESYDLNGAVLRETLPFNLGVQTHDYDLNRRLHSLSSPTFFQTLSYDPGGRVKNISSEGSFTYDDLDELTSESSHTYSYDSRYNRTAKDGEVLSHNDLDENLIASYDLNGNLAQKGPFTLSYDPLNRLVKAGSNDQLLRFTYDPLTRRLSKTSEETELYLYDGVNEIASLDPNGLVKDVRVPGHRNPIAIELGEKVFIPISDCRGNVRRLIDPYAQIFQSYDYTAFGEETTLTARPYNPWRYVGKRFDVELGLSYFGHRYYDANMGRWISTDPAGFIDGTNLYAYALNNPLSFFDPDGRSIGGFVLGLGEIILGGTIMAGGFALEAITVGGFTLGLGVTTSAGALLMGHGLSLTTTHAQDMSFSGSRRGSVDWGLGASSSMPQIASNGYGNVIVKNNQKSENEKKQAPRTEPKNLEEQLALDEAKAKPYNRNDEIMPDKIKDPNYPKDEWKKVGHIHRNPDGTVTDIHYWENHSTGEKHGFKFKNN